MLTPHAYLMLTSFGGIMFILPFIITIAFSLALTTPPRTAVVWLFATGCALGTILILKLVFIPCGTFIGNFGIHSPSGHMAGAVTAYGGLAVVIHRMARHDGLKWGVFFIAALFCAAIGYSRIVLGAHVPNEIYLGALAGLISPLVLFFALPVTIPVLPKPLVLLAPALTIAILLLVVGEAGITPEGYISNLSRQIAAYFHICGFSG